MTLVEFIAPLSRSKNQDRILAVMYYEERYEQKAAMTAATIRQALRTARVKGWARVNVLDVLNRSGAFVDTSGFVGRARLWKLTDSGRAEVRRLLGLPQADPEVEHDISTLQSLIAKVPDPDVRDYLAEALKCLQVDALRAGTVFVWAAAIRTIQTEALALGSAAATAALQVHDPKVRPVKNINDFAYVRDETVLLAAKDLGILDKSEKDTLKEDLDLRNRCGHPSKFRPGVKKVSAFVEDITSIVFA